MKVNIALVILICVINPAIAQSGLLGLYYGEDCATACDKLDSLGFRLILEGCSIKQYINDSGDGISEVCLIVNPDDSLLIGWDLIFDKSLSDAKGTAILAEIRQLHGADYVDEPELGYMEWPLTDSKLLQLNYDEPVKLLSAVYFDEDYHELFNQAMNELYAPKLKPLKQ